MMVIGTQSLERDPIQKTYQDVILQREWANKRALELLAGTEVGKRIIRIKKFKNKKNLEV